MKHPNDLEQAYQATRLYSGDMDAPLFSQAATEAQKEQDKRNQPAMPVWDGAAIQGEDE
jgi:hypothetical protein